MPSQLILQLQEDIKQCCENLKVSLENLKSYKGKTKQIDDLIKESEEFLKSEEGLKDLPLLDLEDAMDLTDRHSKASSLSYFVKTEFIKEERAKLISLIKVEKKIYCEEIKIDLEKDWQKYDLPRLLNMSLQQLQDNYISWKEDNEKRKNEKKISYRMKLYLENSGIIALYVIAIIFLPITMIVIYTIDKINDDENKKSNSDVIMDTTPMNIFEINEKKSSEYFSSPLSVLPTTDTNETLRIKSNNITIIQTI